MKGLKESIKLEMFNGIIIEIINAVLLSGVWIFI